MITGRYNGVVVCDPSGAAVGLVGSNGKEYLFGGLANSPNTAPPNFVYTSAVSFTSGTINGVTIGATTPAAGRFTTLEATGDFKLSKNITINTNPVTQNTSCGAATFLAGQGTLVINNNLVNASTIVGTQIQGLGDATLTSVTAVAAAGVLTLYSNAGATSNTNVFWFIIN